MRVARLETFACDAGWRPWLFVKVTTDDGLVGWSEVTDSHGSPTGLAGVVQDLAPLVVGRDPLAVEAIHWELYRRTRQSPGSIVQKAIGGIENALLDLKGKALGVSVAQLFGGPTRETVPLDWSHCGTTRARAWEVTGTPKLESYDAVAALGREVVERGYAAFKTNIVVPGDEPQVLMPGLREGRRTVRNPTPEVLDALTRLLEAFREGPAAARSRSSTSTSTSRRRGSSGSPARSSRMTSSGSRWTPTTPRRSRMPAAARRSRSARARTSTRSAGSARTSRQARWMWPRSTSSGTALRSR